MQGEVQHTVLSFVCFRALIMDTTPADVEAPKDPGAQQTHLQSFSEKDFEGKYNTDIIYRSIHASLVTSFVSPIKMVLSM
jgi:hypothetical protein